MRLLMRLLMQLLLLCLRGGIAPTHGGVRISSFQNVGQRLDFLSVLLFELAQNLEFHFTLP
jgi:hypothetical protein